MSLIQCTCLGLSFHKAEDGRNDLEVRVHDPRCPYVVHTLEA